MAEKHLQQYEMMVMLKPDLTQKANKEALQTVRDFITEAGGKINHEDIWEKRDLAYMIKGYDQAFYVILYFTLDPKELAELKADLDLEQTILRKMVIKFPANLTMEGYLEESKRAQAKEDEIEAERKEKADEKMAKDAERAAARKRPEKTETPAEETEAKA